MTKLTPLVPPLVEVKWIDAHVSTDRTSVKKAEKDPGIITVTRGILVAETDAGITIAMDWWPKTPKEFRVSTFIPWEMVLDYIEYCQ